MFLPKPAQSRRRLGELAEELELKLRESENKAGDEAAPPRRKSGGSAAVRPASQPAAAVANKPAVLKYELVEDGLDEANDVFKEE